MRGEFGFSRPSFELFDQPTAVEPPPSECLLFAPYPRCSGQFLESEYHHNQNRVEVYDPAVNIWTRVANLPAPMGHIGPGTFTSAEGIFVLGGYSNIGSRLDHDLFVRIFT